jgi:predicted transcriptional regulator of viral defense system
MAFIDYIHDVIKNGKCTFSIEDAEKKLHKSRKAIRASIEHLLAKNELVSPAKGFYVIVPPEYQILGCIPAEFFIPYLMKYWNINYYACLLTAAKYHGATHQAVMAFQVMIENPRPPIICGKIKIKFIANKNLSQTPIQMITTRMSMLAVSTPEGTSMDLLNYPHQSAGLNHITTVLAELQESMAPNKLLVLAENSPILAWKQRLGFILEMLNAHELAKVLKVHLSKQKRVDYILLSPGAKVTKLAKKNTTWKIIENTKIESDI